LTPPTRCAPSIAGWPRTTRCPPAPAELTRGLLERYFARVQARKLSTGQKARLLGILRTFLDDVRMHGWAPGLAPTVVRAPSSLVGGGGVVRSRV
jgi:hypothetical protein